MLARFFLVCFLVLTWAVGVAFLPLWLAVLLGFFATVFWFLLNLYPDKFLLHYFQARETIETDYPAAYRVARAQAHKFKIMTPRIYSYSGFFHRAYALGDSSHLTFLVERKILEEAGEDELEALFFALSLLANEKIAPKHTLALLTMAVIWAPALKVLSMRKKPLPGLSWLIQFLIAPAASAVFNLAHPSTIWKKFLQRLGSFSWENARLRELNSHLDQPKLEASTTRSLSFRFLAANHTSAQQMILAIEGAPHPLDHLQTSTLSGEHA